MRPPQHRSARASQRGAALMLMLVIMVMGIAAILVRSMSSTALQIERDRITADALAQAKEALIGDAVTDANRPGSLPCPDTNNDGSAEPFSGSNCPNYIGRLPWKTLGLPDLRDGAGERLWYALSLNLRDTGSAINSDSAGQLAVIGTTSLSNVAAIVFASGSPLSGQTRNSPEQNTVNNNTVSNYLEGSNANGDAVFVTSLSSDTFNDLLLAITTDQIFPMVEKRIASEVSNCLQDYAANNLNRYPWAAPLYSSLPPNYSDNSDTMFGRLPEPPFDYTHWDSWDGSSYQMSDHYPGSSAACTSVTTWWNNTNWKELIFYSLASRYKPNDYLPSSSCSTCLVANPPSATADKKIVIIVSGKMLTGQQRSSYSNKSNPNNYLEGSNANGASPFEQRLHPSTTFNDTLTFQ